MNNLTPERKHQGSSTFDPELEPLTREYDIIHGEIERRETIENPISYGLPDLLKPIMYIDGLKRIEVQNEALKQFIESQLWFEKDGIRRIVKMIPEMLAFVADLFYGRTKFAILWKPRGGGGSLAAALVIWLRMVYFKQSWLDMAGSGAQAQVVYEYVKSFWKCFPEMEQRLLKGSPQITKTTLVTNAELVCVACSEKQVRGKHKGGFCADEANQKDDSSSVTFEAAMQGVFSEAEPTVMLMSTFHWPFGFFQEYWDKAPEKGFVRYSWKVFDTMKKCTVGLEHATDTDKEALNYCKTFCPLTDRIPIRDAKGNVLEIRYEGCAGYARHTDGFQSFENILKAKSINAGGSTWKIEFCCERPKVRGNVYHPGKVEAASVKEVNWIKTGAKTVGVDWGLMSMCVLTMVCLADDGIVVPEAKVFEGASADEVADFILMWQEKYGELTVYADAEETYGNQQLSIRGLTVVPVHFAKWKKWGIDNLNMWLEYGKLKLLDEGDVSRVIIPHLKMLHKTELGKVVKKDDHGADSLMCGVLPFDFMDLMESVVKKRLTKMVDGKEMIVEKEEDATQEVELL